MRWQKLEKQYGLSYFVNRGHLHLQGLMLLFTFNQLSLLKFMWCFACLFIKDFIVILKIQSKLTLYHKILSSCLFFWSSLAKIYNYKTLPKFLEFVHYPDSLDKPTLSTNKLQLYHRCFQLCSPMRLNRVHVGELSVIP